MVIYEYSTIKVGLDSLEESLGDYSQAGWEVVNILPAVYSEMHKPFTELHQVLVVLRSPIGDTEAN